MKTVWKCLMMMTMLLSYIPVQWASAETVDDTIEVYSVGCNNYSFVESFEQGKYSYHAEGTVNNTYCSAIVDLSKAKVDVYYNGSVFPHTKPANNEWATDSYWPLRTGSNSIVITVTSLATGRHVATYTIDAKYTKRPGNPPSAWPSAIRTTKNTPVQGTFFGTEPDGQSMGFNLYDQGNKGRVAKGIGNAYTYTPNPNATGEDSFTYFITDSWDFSELTTVKVFINDPASTNLVPVAESQRLRTAPAVPLTGTVSANDPERETVTFHLGRFPSKGTVDFDEETGNFTYHPLPGSKGEDAFTFFAYDGTGASEEATVTIDITEKTNHVPVAQNLNIATDINTPVSGSLSGLDEDSEDILTYSIVDPAGKGTVDLTSATGAFTYTPNPNASGEDAFTYRVHDGEEYSSIATVTVTISDPTPANKLPVAYNGSVSTKKNVAVNGLLKATDGDNDPLTYSIVQDGSKGHVTLTDSATGAFTYTPTSGATGTDTFTFKASDGKGDSNIATVTVKFRNQLPPYYPVESVQLDHTRLTFTQGADPVRLSATIMPSYATFQQIRWISSNPDIASVDQSGLVTPKKSGETVISVITLDNQKQADCVVVVESQEVDVTGVTLDQSELHLKEKGKPIQLHASIQPDNATNKHVTWKSSNPKVAAVDQGGKVTPLRAGEATITVTTMDGKKTDTCKVLVSSKSIVRLEASEEDVTMKPGEKHRLQIYSIGENGKKRPITNKRDLVVVPGPEKLITYKRGMIYAGQEEGETTLTVSYQGHQLVIPIKVSKKK